MNEDDSLTDVRPEAIAAMEAIFALSAAIDDDMSIQDLVDVMSLSIAGGHDLLALQLLMAQQALQLARPATEDDATDPTCG